MSSDLDQLNDDWYTTSQLAGQIKALFLITLALLPAALVSKVGARTVLVTYLIVGLMLVAFVSLTIKAHKKQSMLHSALIRSVRQR